MGVTHIPGINGKFIFYSNSLNVKTIVPSKSDKRKCSVSYGKNQLNIFAIDIWAYNQVIGIGQLVCGTEHLSFHGEYRDSNPENGQLIKKKKCVIIVFNTDTCYM